MTFLDIMKLWTIEKTLTAINQMKTTSTYVFDKYFKGVAKPVMGTTAKLKIKKGAGVVLKTILPGADRLVRDLDGIYELTIELPRFGLSGQILAHEINAYESLEGEAKVESISQKIAEIIKEHKDDYMTTIEHMSTGALFGKVVDGDGKVLFEFNTTVAPVEFKNKTIIESLNKIDDALVDELGKEVPYEILASRDFMTRTANNATAAELFKTGEAKWINQDDKRILEVHGTKFIPYSASYLDENGNKKVYIEAGAAVVIPNTPDVFQLVYGRADHIEAVKSAPKLFFASKPEELEKGKGWGIETETKPLPYCVRPGALIKLFYTD